FRSFLDERTRRGRLAGTSRRPSRAPPAPGRGRTHVSPCAALRCPAPWLRLRPGTRKTAALRTAPWSSRRASGTRHGTRLSSTSSSTPGGRETLTRVGTERRSAPGRSHGGTDGRAYPAPGRCRRNRQAVTRFPPDPSAVTARSFSQVQQPFLRRPALRLRGTARATP